jgi:hypothetical protein
MSTLNVADYNRMGQVYVAANNATTNHIAVAATQTGLCLYNPPGSRTKFILVDWGFVYVTVPGAIHQVGLCMSFTNPTVATVTAATVTSGVRPADGRATQAAPSVAVVGSSIAYGSGVAPVAIRWPFGAAWNTAGTTVGISCFRDTIDGAIVLVPGSALATCALTTTAAGMASFTWIEVPA